MTAVISYKLIIIGASGVGKSAILRRLVEDTFTDECQSTIGVDFDSKVLMVGDKRVKLQIWDTAGQERFRSIAKSYYRNAVGVILVYDITDRKSFEELSQWLTEVHSLCEANAVVELIGNKTDLAGKRVVSESEALDFCERHQLEYIETSAKGGDNVRESFVRMAAKIMERGLKSSTPALDKSPLDSGEASGQNSCC